MAENTLKINLRTWRISDLDSLVTYANNWNIAKNLMDRFPHPYTEEDAKSFIEYAGGAGAAHIFAIELRGQAIGGISLEPQADIHRKNAELGYWLAEPFWGQGIISQAIKQMVDYAFATYDIDRIVARPFGHNVASHRVLKKNGFVLEATLKKVLYKNDQYMDEWIYAIRKQTWEEQKQNH
ncbi:GNAT family protein [Rhodocytophaga aerolata]|uniref:GNAT family protein n=1 Tax=Rhodocytophaga aerolata TaxID=455078 RepID=A0ABT8QZC1_9BACT|nr:GNAT family protein [Rhodocytophaga aerolata]MDO1445191.1 GNAT family protein [Rhodocytophaga aerolata]